MRITSDLQGTVVSVEAQPGSTVGAGRVLAVIESMKMHHDVLAPVACRVDAVLVQQGRAIAAGADLFYITEIGESERAHDEATADGAVSGSQASGMSAAGRADVAEVNERHRLVLDEARSEVVAKRHERGHRTAREIVGDLVDDGSFVEYGSLVIAAQRRRKSIDELIRTTPADGLVGGIGTVNGDLFEGRDSRCVVMSYDYTVLAGTQGNMNHRKKDRLFEVAERLRLPVVFFAEGGGGRPGDTDVHGVTLLDCLAFNWFAKLSALVPLVGITTGYCFAGNAAILGCCDVVIATEGSNIGMGGPAMIEGGGLGVYEPTAVGPVEVQRANGVVDIVAADDEAAAAVAKQYLGYFQGTTTSWEVHDQTALRTVVPENRLKAYRIRDAIEGLFDVGSVLELRRDFGVGMITALARIEGRPVGVLANNPSHLAGAIDADGSDKAARFLQLCDTHGLPVITLCDTPGMMVGPEVEATALVRHCCRLFVVGANMTVPTIAVVLRKAYGLGAQAMMGGSTKAPLACLAWPTGEFGPMGLEGAVRLGFRRELDAIDDHDEREREFRRLVDQLYEGGKAINVASYLEIDDVIDPVDTRHWLSTLLESAPPVARDGKRRPHLDTW
jgi:acetyl-CoA carboxylase carboxyltransferase component